MRFALALLLLVLLPGCATNPRANCLVLAGPGWNLLRQAPPNARQLLAQENLPPDRELLWLGKGPQQLIACYYARGMTNPACGGSVAYKFVQQDGLWTSQGQLIDFCDTGPS